MANIPLAPPIAPALALTQGVPEVMYDLAQWAAWQHFGTRVSVKRAHKKLAALRAAMAPGTTVTEQTRDLGRDQEMLDYISCRDDAQEIIGSGITNVGNAGATGGRQLLLEHPPARPHQCPSGQSLVAVDYGLVV